MRPLLSGVFEFGAAADQDMSEAPPAPHDCRPVPLTVPLASSCMITVRGMDFWVQPRRFFSVFRRSFARRWEELGSLQLPWVGFGFVGLFGWLNP
jgi:hypothetical protein